MRNNRTNTHNVCIHKILIALAITEMISITFSGSSSLLSLSFAEYRITDFRLPESSAMDFDIIGGLNASYEDNYNNLSQYQMGGRLGVNFKGFSGTEEKDIYGALHFDFDPQLYKYADIDTSYKYLSSYIDMDEWLSSYAYINKTNFFGAPSVGGNISWWYDRYDTDWYSHRIYGGFNMNFLLGYGRIRDGTDAWRAMEIEKILTSEGLISEPLGSNEIMELAQTINREREYGIKFDRAEKHYYKAIETVLQAMGIEHVPAYTWFKIKEILEEDIKPREFGLQLGLGPHAEGYGSYSFKRQDYTSTDYSTGGGRIDLMVSLNSAYPLTHRLQYNETANIYWGEDGILCDLHTGFAYLIAIKLEIELVTELQRYIIQYPSAKKLQQNVVFNIVYYLEDNVSIGVYNYFNHCWDTDEIYDYTHRNRFSSGISISYDVW